MSATSIRKNRVDCDPRPCATARVKALLAAAHVALGALLLAGSARADEEGGRAAQAERLFEGARADMANGRYADACPKFSDSNTLDPGAGTMLNLAYCYEKLGKRAQAWSTYQSAAVAAREDGKPDWETAAHARASQLEPTVAWLVVHVDRTTDASRLDIRLDGEPFGVGRLERPTPIDPGRHDVKVSAEGKQTWATTLEVGAEDTPTVEVPVLEPLPMAVPVPVSHPPPATGAEVHPAHRWGSQRIAAVALAGAGVGALGVASGFALSSLVARYGADCGGGGACTAQGANARSRAYGQFDVAGVVAGAGAVSLAAAALLWWMSPSHTQSVRVEPTAGQTSWGLSVRGAW
jgi:hypothetical protein